MEGRTNRFHESDINQHLGVSGGMHKGSHQGGTNNSSLRYIANTGEMVEIDIHNITKNDSMKLIC